MIFVAAWMYDKTLEEPVIEDTNVEIKTKMIKYRLNEMHIKILTEGFK